MARKTTARIRDGSNIGSGSFTSNVKNALMEYLNRMERERGLILNKGSLTNALNARGIRVSKQTIEDIFNTQENRAINFEVIVGICEVLGIRITDILPNKGDPYYGHPPAVWDSRVKSDVGVDALPPRYYMGTYHCYYFRPAYLFDRVDGSRSETQTQPIFHATLTLSHEQGVTKAKFEEDGIEPKFDGGQLQDRIVMEGTANLLIHANQVQVNLRDDRGIRFLSIMFPYIHLARDVLYSQIGSVFNISSEKHRYPLLQKMAIFRKEINVSDERVDAVIRGILSMSSNELLVEKSKFDKFVQEHPIAAQFPRKQEECYVLYEDHVYTSLPLLTDVTYQELTEELMALRNICSNPAIMTIREHERFNSFAKIFQKREAVPERDTGTV